jgi:D-amino-acid dehydrogenase
MDVIVIGGGLAGVATAYQLHAAGHRVCVIERHATVAQGASFGHGALMLPTPLDAWFGPTFMRKRNALKNGVVYKPGWPGFRSGVYGFVRRLAALQTPEAYRAQWLRLKPLVDASREAIAAIEARFNPDFEQSTGVLHVVRQAREWEQNQAALDLLRECEIAHHLLSAAESAELERAVPADPMFAGGIFFEGERSGNCPLFAKLLKQTLDETGTVEFMFGRAVDAIRVDNHRAAVELAPRAGEPANPREVDVIAADAIVVAAGAGSLALLERAGLALPFHPARLFTLTAPIAYEECAPHLTVVDSIKRISMARLNQRVRIAGAAVVEAAQEAAKPVAAPLAEAATTLLAQATRDWIPGAARISAAHTWDGVRLLSPDGLPVVGPALHPRLFVNLGHGPSGWGLACGSAKVIADLVSGTTPGVPPDTLAALRAERFAQ